MTVNEFASSVVKGCQALGGSITSWGRTAAHNVQVGGSPTSRHLAWFAVDVIYDRAIEEAERRRVWEALGLHVWPEGDHDHISWPEGGHF